MADIDVNIDIEDDLHDVFQALYDGDEWADWADDALPGADALDVEADPTPQASRPSLRTLASLRYPLTCIPTKRRIFSARAPAPAAIPSTTALPALDSGVYAPFSPLPLLARLRTFTALTYSPTAPAEVGARALALAGWVNNAVDGVACASASSTSGSSGCSAQWGVGGLDTLPPRVRADVVQRLADLSSRHEKGCAWRVCATPATAVAQLRRLVHPLVSASLGPLARALHVRSLGPVATQWASPLSEDQIGALAKALARTGVQAEPLALVLALFGWYPYDPAAPADHVAPATVPGTAAATDIVACRLCRRRVGLWLFAEGRGRTLDVHAEHLWWCPLADGGWWVDCPLLSSAPPQRLAIAYRPTKRRRRAIPTTAAAPGLPTSTPAPATATLTPVA